MPKPLVISVSEAREAGVSHVFVFDELPVVVGRDASANLIIDRDVVSTVHGVFDIENDGVLTFSDLGSRNGTLLNGQPVPPDEQVAISVRDLLSIGYLHIQVLAERPQPASGPASRNPFAPPPGSNPRRDAVKETAMMSPAEPGAGSGIPSFRDRPGLAAPERRSPATGTAPPDENGIPGRDFRLAPPPSDSGSAGGPRLAPSPYTGGLFQPGNVIGGGRYQIKRLIGAGGMGAVYEAKDFRLNDDVAIKMLSPDLIARPDALKRFEREAQNTREIRSPNVVRIYDYGSEDGVPYIVMELLEGEPLSKLIGRGPLSVTRALRVLIDVINGVIAAHSVPEPIIHRDLKPENIFVMKPGSDALAKVLDFGISKTADSRLTQLGAVIGTRHYQSPEQLTGNPNLDGRSDEFALAVILYEMLTGRPPHEGENAFVVARNIMEGKLKKLRELRPDVPEGLEEVVHRGLEVDPDKRYPTVRHFGSALKPHAPPDAQALFMRLSSGDVFRSSMSLFRIPPPEAAPAVKAGGTALLPSVEPAVAVRPLKTQLLPDDEEPRPPVSAHRRKVVMGVGIGSVVLIGAVLLIATRGPSRPEPPAASVPAETATRPAPGPAPVAVPVPAAAPAPAPAARAPEPPPPIPAAASVVAAPAVMPSPAAPPPAVTMPASSRSSRHRARSRNADSSADVAPHQVGGDDQQVWVLPAKPKSHGSKP